MFRYARAVPLLIILSCAAGALFCQAPQPALTSSATGTSDGGNTSKGEVVIQQETHNVLIDMVVTDKHGQPVTALDKSKFHLTENGAPQQIAFFEEHDLRAAAANPVAAAPAERPANEYTNVETIANRGPLVAILIDLQNSSVADLAYTRTQLEEYLKQVPPGAHVAIFTLSDRLYMVQGFTQDPAVLRAAIDKGSQPNLSARMQAEFFAAQASMDHFFAAGEMHIIRQERQTSAMNALLSISMYLRGMPGRKDLVWFAGDWSWAPIYRTHGEFTMNTEQLDNQMQRLSDIFLASRIALYPVDSRGLVPPAMFDASRGGPSNGRAMAAREMRTSGYLMDEHSWMEQIAGATGGKATYNTNGLAEAVNHAESKSEHYYSIAYSPTDKSETGGFRRVEIHADVPGLKLEYRRGYYARNAAVEPWRLRRKDYNPLGEVMQYGAPGATEIPFRIQLAVSPQQPDPAAPATRLGVEAAAFKGDLVRYKFTWIVDLKRVHFDAQPDGSLHAQLNAALAAYDAGGKTMNHIAGTLPIVLTAEQMSRYRGVGMPISQSLDLPKGLIFMRVALLDAANGHTGATEFPLQVEATKASVAEMKVPGLARP